MNNMESRIKNAYNKMTIEEQYKLMETLEGKNLGQQEGDKDTIESIINILLEITTFAAKILGIIWIQ